MRFTALLHHIYNLETLRMAYFSLKKEAAPGVDGETWRHYGETLELNLQDLSRRLKRGAYRAKPVRRAYIDKSDGRKRPLGVPVLEDKIVQRATVEVLNAIYETDFLDFSYGFRPGRSQHNALDALYTGLLTKKVNWALDLDIRGFFDALSHEWLVKLVEHRIADRRVVRLIQKWLNAGVLVDGKRIRVEEGTPQGGSASPLLANVYLHYVFDLWVQAWRQKRAHGDVIVRPETIYFLGFTLYCTRNQKGNFRVGLRTEKTRLRRALTHLQDQMRRMRHEPLPEQVEHLNQMLRGHYGYYGIAGNIRAPQRVHRAVERYWRRMLSSRSWQGEIWWKHFHQITERYPLVRPKLYLPYAELQAIAVL